MGAADGSRHLGVGRCGWRLGLGDWAGFGRDGARGRTVFFPGFSGDCVFGVVVECDFGAGFLKSFCVFEGVNAIVGTWLAMSFERIAVKPSKDMASHVPTIAIKLYERKRPCHSKQGRFFYFFSCFMR